MTEQQQMIAPRNQPVPPPDRAAMIKAVLSTFGPGLPADEVMLVMGLALAAAARSTSDPTRALNQGINAATGAMKELLRAERSRG